METENDYSRCPECAAEVQHDGQSRGSNGLFVLLRRNAAVHYHQSKR